MYRSRVNGLRTFAKNVLKIPRGLVGVLEPRLQAMARAMLRVLTAGETKAWDEHGEVPDRVVNNIQPQWEKGKTSGDFVFNEAAAHVATGSRSRVFTVRRRHLAARAQENFFKENSAEIKKSAATLKATSAKHRNKTKAALIKVVTGRLWKTLAESKKEEFRAAAKKTPNRRRCDVSGKWIGVPTAVGLVADDDTTLLEFLENHGGESSTASTAAASSSTLTKKGRHHQDYSLHHLL